MGRWKLEIAQQISVLVPILLYQYFIIYFIIYIYIIDLDDDLTSNVMMFADDTKGFRNLKVMQIDSIYKMILISLHNCLISGKCCLFLVNVSAFIKDMGKKTHNIQWVVLY